MAKSNIPISGHENDQILIMTRRHPASMIGAIFLILLMLVLPLFIVFLLVKMGPQFLQGYYLNFLIIIGSAYYLVTLSFAFVQWVSFYYNIMFVTDNEILDIAQEGIFDRRINEVTLLRIQDVSARIKGFFPTLFNYGDVIAESAGENTKTYIIDRIPNPVEVANKILELHNQKIDREDCDSEILRIEGEINTNQSKGQSQVSQSGASTQDCPPCAKTDNSAANSSITQQINQGEIKSEDLNSGGEVKL